MSPTALHPLRSIRFTHSPSTLGAFLKLLYQCQFLLFLPLLTAGQAARRTAGGPGDFLFNSWALVRLQPGIYCDNLSTWQEKPACRTTVFPAFQQRRKGDCVKTSQLLSGVQMCLCSMCVCVCEGAVNHSATGMNA